MYDRAFDTLYTLHMPNHFGHGNMLGTVTARCGKHCSGSFFLATRAQHVQLLCMCGGFSVPFASAVLLRHGLMDGRDRWSLIRSTLRTIKNQTAQAIQRGFGFYGTQCNSSTTVHAKYCTMHDGFFNERNKIYSCLLWTVAIETVLKHSFSKRSQMCVASEGAWHLCASELAVST